MIKYNPDYIDEENDEEKPIYDFRPSKWLYERLKENKKEVFKNE